MHIDRIKLDSFRTFRKAEIIFNHPDHKFRAADLPKPKIPNVNPLRGDNGYGTSTVFEAVVLTRLGPGFIDIWTTGRAAPTPSGHQE